jgi:hypothetical protein
MKRTVAVGLGVVCEERGISLFFCWKEEREEEEEDEEEEEKKKVMRSQMTTDDDRIKHGRV